MFSTLLPKPKHEPVSGEKDLPTVPVSRPKTSLPLNRIRGNDRAVTKETGPHELRISKFYLNEDGTLNYSKTIALAGMSSSESAQTSIEDTIPLKQRYPGLKHYFPRYDLETCPNDSLQKCYEETKAVIDGLLQRGDPSGASENPKEVEYVKYVPATALNGSGNEEDERGRERYLEIRDLKEDPLLPSKFKLRKNRHRTPSPPAPILKNPTTEKLSKEERKKWDIPAAVSNWKNNQGFTISLDKRTMANNPSSGPADFNIEGFSKLSSSLEEADRKAREEITIRNKMLQDIAIREQQEKDRRLKEIAELTRNERSKSKRRREPASTSHKRTKH